MPTRDSLTPEEYSTYYSRYITLVPSHLHLLTVLDDSHVMLYDWLKHVTARQGELYRYAPEKWTVVQAMQHVIDTERIFCYRALRFARADDTALQGFDQDAFAKTAGADTRALADLREEFDVVRASTRHLFKSFTETELSRRGQMSGYEHSVRAIGFIIAGHTFHHKQVFEERYGEAQGFC